MSAWLITIPRNLSRSEYRKRRREVEDADGRHVDSLKSPPQQQSGWNSRNFVWCSRSCRPASGGSASRRRAGLLRRRGGYDLRERGSDDQRAGSIVPARDSRSCSPSTGRQVRPRPHDACRSDRRRARSAARLGGCHFPRRSVGHNRRAGQLNSTQVLFSDFRPRSLVAGTRQRFIWKLELLIMACVRTPFVRGKGGIFMKNRGVFLRKRDKTRLIAILVSFVPGVSPTNSRKG
jgi:hypothetical protein